MRYLVLIVINPDAAGPAEPDERLATEMGTLLQDMTKAGVLLDTAGLRPIEEATRIRLADGKQTVIDGPFTESKEVIGGYWILVANDLDDAAALAGQNPCLACGLTFEVRPLERERASAYDVTSETPVRATK